MNLDCVHTVTFSSVFICVFTLKRMQTLAYQFTTKAVVYLVCWRYFPLDRVNMTLKRLKGQKRFWKTLENDVRVHIASD
jgi:hypothetical protein